MPSTGMYYTWKKREIPGVTIDGKSDDGAQVLFEPNNQALDLVSVAVIHYSQQALVEDS